MLCFSSDTSTRAYDDLNAPAAAWGRRLPWPISKTKASPGKATDLRLNVLKDQNLTKQNLQ